MYYLKEKIELRDIKHIRQNATTITNKNKISIIILSE